MSESYVDPRVSRAKFDREVGRFRQLEADHRLKGWFLLRADFPKVEVLFTAPRLKPAPVVFSAVLDFKDYDFIPPSVRIVDPFSGKAFTFQELNARVQFLQHRELSGFPGGFPGAPGQMKIMQSQILMQAYKADDVPFFCMPGVREYHDQPSHTGDSWLLHRNTGEGTLHNILEQLYASSVRELTGFSLGMTITGFSRSGPPA